MIRTGRVAGVLGAAVAGVALLAAPAGAHVSPDKDEVAAGSFNSVSLTVGHGCEESPTREVSVQIPEGIDDVTPQIHPGWTINVVKTALPTPVDDGEGGQITERESEVVFTASPGNELADGFRDSFGLGFRTPEAEGEYLFFKTIQRCTVGETAWIEEYTGEGEEPEHPSPVLLIGPAEEDGEDSTTDTTMAEEEDEDPVEVDEAAATSEDDDDDSSSTGIAVAGLVAGLLGLGAGGLALVRSRSTS